MADRTTTLPCRPPVAVRLLTLGGAHVEGGGRSGPVRSPDAVRNGRRRVARGIRPVTERRTLSIVVSTPSPGPSLPHLVDLPPLVLRRVVVAEDLACFRLAGCLAPASSGRGGIRHLLLPLREAGRGQPSIKLSTHSFPRAERVLPSSWAGWGPPSRPAPPTGWRRQLLSLSPDRAPASQICPGVLDC